MRVGEGEQDGQHVVRLADGEVERQLDQRRLEERQMGRVADADARRELVDELVEEVRADAALSGASSLFSVHSATKRKTHSSLRGPSSRNASYMPTDWRRKASRSSSTRCASFCAMCSCFLHEWRAACRRRWHITAQ